MDTQILVAAPPQSPKPLLLRRRLIVFGLVIIFLLDVGLVYSLQTSRRISAGDFFVVWYATRQMVFEHRDPYSQEVTNGIQVAFAGQVFGPEVEDQLSFNYPLFTALYVLPLTPFDYPLAEAIWNVINQFAMAGAVWAWVRLVGWRATSPLQACLPYIAAFLAYPFFFTLVYGQYTVVTLFFALSGALLLRRGHFWAGGAVVALALFKPQSGAVLVAFLMLWCLVGGRQRWPALVSGVGVGLSLLLGPMLWQGDWPWRWLEQAGYRRVHPGMYSFDERLLSRAGLSLAWAVPVATLLAVGIGLSLAWLWWRDRNSPERLPVLIGLTGLVTLLVLPQYGFCNDITVYPAAFLGLAWLCTRLSPRLVLALTLVVVLTLYGVMLNYFVLMEYIVAIPTLCWLGFELRRSISRPNSVRLN